MISLKNADKYYNKGTSSEIHVMKEISLDLPDKGLVALHGRSGCGKTTMLNAIGGLAELSSGEILIDGNRMQTKDVDLRNQYIGYVFQDYCLNPQETVYENVAAALYLVGLTDEQEVAERVQQTLESVGMERFARRLPGTLSGGQQQRVAIARAIVKNPAVLLADEPTGNLDEENTHQVMRILQAFGKQRLVVLVTHEDELVELYCDKVIELSDGEVTEVRDVEKGAQASRRNKNHIYLGELVKQEQKTPFGHFRFYGDAPEKVPDICLINVDGQLLVRILDSDVRIIEESDEIQIMEGTFEEEHPVRQELPEAELLLRALPEQREKTGRLFRMGNSLRLACRGLHSGRGKRTMPRVVLALFAVLLVWFVALLGTSFESILEARSANNANSFYLLVSGDRMCEELEQGIANGTAGIDYAGYSGEMIMMDREFYISLNQFETAEEEWNPMHDMAYHATVFSEQLLTDAKVICGKAENLEQQELVITSAVAKLLLENCRLASIDTFEELVGLETKYRLEDYANKIVGIVESPEYAVYYSEETLASYRYREELYGMIRLGTDYDCEVEKGTVIYRIKDGEETTVPEPGSRVCINGVELTVAESRRISFSYEDWLSSRGIVKPERTEEQTVYEYAEEYYQEYEAYAKYCYEHRSEVECSPYMILLLEGNKDILFAEIAGLCDAEYYYYAAKYKEEHGSFPDDDRLEEVIYEYEYPRDEIEEEMYERRLEEDGSCVLLLSPEDYIACSISCGEVSGFGFEKVTQGRKYATLHANDPEKAEAFLAEHFSSSPTTSVWEKAYWTPQDQYEMELRASKDDLVRTLIIGGIGVAILCICVYLMMRSRVLARTREIGIYRCIGVRRSNIVFRFLIETLVLTGSSAGLGFLITSAALWWAQSGDLHYMTKGVIYYPVWLGLILLLFLLLLTTACGVLPLLGVLRRSPSEIITTSEM